MLKSLLIENYALIDKLDIDFNSGFSVITGETGAGKSIILGALGLVLGQRADSKVIKDEQRKCIIEATFDITNYHLQPFFDENELDYDVNCIIRREMSANGKSRSFVNDTPINVNILKDFATRLIDIHSQHENLLISNKSFQFNVVDTVARTANQLTEFRQKYTEYKKLLAEIAALVERVEKEKADADYFQFQLDQLQTAALHENEQEELEQEQELLTHAEEIKSALTKVDWLLSDEDKGVLVSLKESTKTMQHTAAIYHKIGDLSNRLESCYIELKDLSGEIDILHNDLEFDQDRLNFVNERLNLIYDLEQKHRVKTIAELLTIAKELNEKLQSINSFDEQLAAFEKQKQELFSRLMKMAQDLSAKRKSVVTQIEKTICSQLSQLGMPNVQFIVSVSETEAFTSNGINEIEFLFSANKNMSPQSIAKIASGGEISRVMLCVKALLSDNVDVPTIIFDEIDTGVSGDIADKMGDIMKQMAKKIQVISITHLPQIAAKGAEQYKVFKSDKGDSTETQIKKLDRKERVTEIAQMLSGSVLSEAAIKNAEVLLSNN